jgi:hypothetical protein
MSQDALELLLTGVKDQGQRKQITTAYYAFANGDPETFAVQFAVLLRAHATSLKFLPARLEKALSAETRKLGDLVIAHQNAIGRMASLIDQARKEDGVGERKDPCARFREVIENQLTAHADVLKSEGEKITSTLASHEKLLQRLDARRMLLTIILSFIGGALTTLLFQELLSLLEPMLH